MSKTLHLEDESIIRTVDRLGRRIEDRFPGAGLSKLCGKLQVVAKQSAVRAEGIGRRVVWIRSCGYLLAALVVILLVATAWYVSHTVRWKDEAVGWTTLISTFDAATSGLIVLGATIYFLINLEMRIKRRRAISAIHELRSIAHVIDMHQLTKDPERVLRRYRQTSNSPSDTMSAFELNRYLDYCSEMLSLIGKIAALYVQRFDDPVAVAAVSEVEQLTTSLSRKIWQKIMLLSQLHENLMEREPSKQLSSTNATDDAESTAPP
ncbi:MAG: hypothetical protein AAFV88_06170 [Planctomycetota bacterium]